MHSHQPTIRAILGDSRGMAELARGSISLVVTSPPYWSIKDYGHDRQIGCGQSLHEYLYDLSRVWQESHRVLKPGRRLCVNIGEQFARATQFGRYRIIPLHAEIIAQCLAAGFDYMGAIIWRKKTTLETSGGAVVMGSFPYPPNGIVELDYEYILLFRSAGVAEPLEPEAKRASGMSKEEWRELFSGHWSLGGARQQNHQAMFPEEIPRRLIRMFSAVGETVLDPFAGSGTTLQVARDLRRPAVGYEIQSEFQPLIRQRLGVDGSGLPLLDGEYRFEEQRTAEPGPAPLGYRPATPEMAFSGVGDEAVERRRSASLRVTEIIDERTLRLEDGTAVALLGICVPPAMRERAISYLKGYVLRRRVRIRRDGKASAGQDGEPQEGYMTLANGICINRVMLKMGLAAADRSVHHSRSGPFVRAEETTLEADQADGERDTPDACRATPNLPTLRLSDN